MSIIKIVKENSAKIPVGTLLHYTSFFDEPKSDCSAWNCIKFYVYKDIKGKIKTIKEGKITPSCYVNVIVVSNLKMVEQGELYWKVFYLETAAKCRMLEDGGKSPALIFKPYKDRVNDITNTMPPSGQQRFATESEALEYIAKCKK